MQLIWMISRNAELRVGVGNLLNLSMDSGVVCVVP